MLSLKIILFFCPKKNVSLLVTVRPFGFYYVIVDSQRKIRKTEKGFKWKQNISFSFVAKKETVNRVIGTNETYSFPFSLESQSRRKRISLLRS